MKYAIVGGGIGGLTLALAFEKRGIDYTLYEKVPELKEVGAGIWLAPNALQVLDHLNVLDEVKEAGNSIDRITLAKNDLTPLSDNNQTFIKDKFGYSTIAIHRARLQQILYSQLPKDKVQMGKGFEAFTTLSDGTIRVAFEDQTIAETDKLIGADGIHSKVRNQIFPQSTVRYSGQTCWRGIADFQLDDKFANRGFELWGGQIRFGISKIDDNKVYWFAVAMDERNGKDSQELIQEKLLDLFQDFHTLVLDIIKATSKNKMVRNDIIDLKPMPNWFLGNVCLIGDAAHATTPNMGQGGAQAIEDAYYLSHCIDQDSNIDAFELFQSKRQKKVNSIVKQSWMTGKMAHWKYAASLRNFVLKNMPQSLMNKKMLEMYHIDL